ncbi:hypothetical protein [Ruegeria hyattellae]|jgi:hypothetical protein|uniref:hypothetical protein n=1 Tax=Ruegeria hyattellae TaxID=3233337 RepID=UPI00355C4637
MMSERMVVAISTGLIIALSFLIDTLNSAPAIFIVFGFVVLGLAYGQASAIMGNRLAPEYRYSDTAMATNLSWITGAAFAPQIGLGLTVAFGLSASALYLISGVVVTFFALYRLNRLKAAHAG